MEHTISAGELERLRQARLDYGQAVSPSYDEVFHEVVDRIAEAGSVGKSDIGALLFWKRLRANSPWVTQLMAMTDAEVRDDAAEAVTAVNDTSQSAPNAAGAGRAALSPLPGFTTGDALASAVLAAAAPERMAAYDRRAHQAVRTVGLTLSDAPGRYHRYMAIVASLKKQLSEGGNTPWSTRDVDVALFWLGQGPEPVSNESRIEPRLE